MSANEELLVAFYQGVGRDARGRTHAEIVGWTDAKLEAVHDYIQWLFPLPEPSGANPSAPLLTSQVLAAFAESPQMRERLHAAWLRMLAFYGFARQSDGAVVRDAVFAAQARHWLTPYNHNHLRLTRILRCLRRVGFEAESQAMFAALRSLYDEDARRGAGRISADTFGYWQRAVG